MRRLRYALLVLLVHTVQANDQPVVTEVSRTASKTYQVMLVFFVRASVVQVHSILTDYANIKQLNSSIQSVKQHDVPDLRGDRVEVVIRDCILFFCKSVRRVEDISYPNGYEIKGTVVPHLSDFSAGQSHWLLEPRNSAQTKVSFNATFTIKGWVPPLVGPHAIRMRARQRLLESVENMHRLLHTSKHE